MRIDHVVRAVGDLDRAAGAFRALGLESVEGGRHARWGTANRIVPLGASYLELLAVVEPDAAGASALGRSLLDAIEGGDAWFAVCVADDDMDRTADRLGLVVEPGRRSRPDGSEIGWRGAGVDDPRRDASLPFFIAWDPGGEHPGSLEGLRHPCGATGIETIEISGEQARVDAWVGGASLPIRVSPGDPAIVEVRLSTEDGAGLSIA